MTLDQYTDNEPKPHFTRLIPRFPTQPAKFPASSRPDRPASLSRSPPHRTPKGATVWPEVYRMCKMCKFLSQNVKQYLDIEMQQKLFQKFPFEDFGKI